jgi:D-glycero-D-manno-heptose 1,7-bisphosphate phosphatase
MSSAAAFVDRDGTINVRPKPHCYVESPSEFRWLPGAVEGLVRLANAGLRLVVVSNQRGVARGLVSEQTLRTIEAEIQDRLMRSGAEIAEFRYCPHELTEGCDCRKPRPGMLLAAAQTLDLDLSSSWMIGDAGSDVQAGVAAGCRTVLIGAEDRSTRATIYATDLLDASEQLLALTPPGQRTLPVSNPATRDT